MRIRDNMDQMGEQTYNLLRGGLLLSAALLSAGCAAILQGNLAAADSWRDLAASVLLITTVLSCCMAKRE